MNHTDPEGPTESQRESAAQSRMDSQSSPTGQPESNLLEPLFLSQYLPAEPDYDPALPSDSRTPFGWLDLLSLLVFYVVCGIILTLLVAGGAFLISGVWTLGASAPLVAKATVTILAQALLSGATLIFLFVLLRGRSSALFWPAVGWHAFRKAASPWSMAIQYVFVGSGLALLTGLAGRLVGKDSDLPIEELFRSRQTVVMMMALGIFVAPLVEETIFRGCIYPVITRKFGLPVGVVATGVLFGMAHAQQLWGAWGQIALLIGVGITFTWIRARAGTVAASYFVHVGYNTTLFAGFFLATGGLRYFPS